MSGPQEHEISKVSLPQPTAELPYCNALVAAAIDYIQQHACDGINTEDVLDHLADRGMIISRSTLERRFRRIIGVSPRAAILAVQIKRAQQMLATTDYPIVQIAELVGISRPEHFSATFRRATGMLPSQVRRKAIHNAI